MKQSLFGRLGQKAKSWEFVLLLILILEFIIFGAKNPKFLMPNVLLGSINDIISICIISLFVTFVMITGGIDIQAGSIVGLTSIMAKHGTNYAVVFAAMTLSALPILIVFFAAQRFFIRGLAEGIGK